MAKETSAGNKSQAVKIWFLGNAKAKPDNIGFIFIETATLSKSALY